MGNKSNADAIYAEGLQFACIRCSACCRGGPGFVFLQISDLEALSRKLGLSIPEFLDNHCRIIQFGDEYLYSLREKQNFDCSFWDGGCIVYDARPLQCRTYPFWAKTLSDRKSWEEESTYCPGIGRGPRISSTEIDAKLDARAQEAPIGPSFRKRFS